MPPDRFAQLELAGAALLGVLPAPDERPAPEDFSDLAARAVFSAALTLDGRGEAIGCSSIADELQRMGELGAIQWSGLHELSWHYVTADTVPIAARRVRREGARRRARDALGALAGRDLDDRDVRERLRGELEALDRLDEGRP